MIDAMLETTYNDSLLVDLLTVYKCTIKTYEPTTCTKSVSNNLY